MRVNPENSGGQLKPISGRLRGADAPRRASVRAKTVQVEERIHSVFGSVTDREQTKQQWMELKKREQTETAERLVDQKLMEPKKLTEALQER